jgi:phospholipid/cholesterol/gamma-HCH transport system ATP-binding protein
VGVEVRVEGLSKSFGKQVIWQDVSLTLPAGEISVLLGPSGTGKSVFLKHLVGLLRPDRGHVWIEGRDVPHLSEHELYETRKLFGVLFQDGALFGSMNIFDNVAFPLREHTKKGEPEIKQIVMEKLEMVGLANAESKLPGEISGGMRKRAGLARALVLDPEIILFDEPDSGLDPVRVAYLNQLIVDLNAQIGATMLIVTHDIGTARTVPDNIGLLFRRELVMFGPREELLTSDIPVVRQFLNGRMEGPIGMAEEKDEALVAQELASVGAAPLPAAGAGPKGAGGAGVPVRLRPSGTLAADDPAPDLLDQEPDIGTRAAIGMEREQAPADGGPMRRPRRPIDRDTGEVLPRPSGEPAARKPRAPRTRRSRGGDT